jgi:small subunit ribosomal protein S5
VSETGPSDKSILESWTPKTTLGRLVLEGKITSIEEIFRNGYKIREPEIIDILLPNLTHEVLDTAFVQKQTDAGERSRFRVIVASGDMNGHLGIGFGKATQWRIAFQKAIKDAKLNMTIIKRGCGSWECNCNIPHSLPFKVEGKCGGVSVVLLPAPKGLGLVAGDITRVLLRLAGIKDCWVRTFGSTRTHSSLIKATFEALKSTYELALQKR